MTGTNSTQTQIDENMKPRSWRKPQFTIKSTLILTLIVGLIIAWHIDQRQLRSGYSEQLERETVARQDAESRWGRFSEWYVINHSIENLPNEFKQNVAEKFVAGEEGPGFRLFVVPNARFLFSQANLHGNSLRVRGGPIRYELVAEDVSEEEPQVLYRFTGPDGPTQNADCTFTFFKTRTPFKYVSGERRWENVPYQISVSDAQHVIAIPPQDLWPEWVCTAEKLEGSRESTLPLVDHQMFSPNEPVTVFSQEQKTVDGRKARVRLTITCGPRIPDEAAADTAH